MVCSLMVHNGSQGNLLSIMLFIRYKLGIRGLPDMYTVWLLHIQCWGSYFLKVIYYLLLFTTAKGNAVTVTYYFKIKVFVIY